VWHKWKLVKCCIIRLYVINWLNDNILLSVGCYHLAGWWYRCFIWLDDNAAIWITFILHWNITHSRETFYFDGIFFRSFLKLVLCLKKYIKTFMWAEININILGFALKRNENVHSFIHFYWQPAIHEPRNFKETNMSSQNIHTNNIHTDIYIHSIEWMKKDKIIFKPTQE
jgi:hypothetical protein